MFRVSILDIKKSTTIFREMVSSVVLPGEEGELSVLDFHQSIVSCLKNGIIKIDRHRSIPIERGIARMERNELVVLVEKA